MTAALRFFVLIEVLGLAATPLAAVAFARLPGRGVAFAKPLGLLVATWLVWMTGSLGLVPVRPRRCWIGAAALLVVAGALVWWRRRPPLWEGMTRRCRLWSEGIALRRVRRDGAARRLLARRLADREADGHGVHQRGRRRATRSRPRTRGWRARTSTTTTSAT